MKDLSELKEMFETKKVSKGVKDELGSGEKKKHTERWSGVVVNNNDEKMLGRCQVRVIGYYDNLSDNNLPFAVPDISYLGSTKGSMVIPENGSVVRGYFDKGDIQRPIYDSVAFSISNTESDFTNRRDKTSYPHNMVLMETDNGDFLTLNRKTGELVFTHRTGAMYKIDSDGNMELRTGSSGEIMIKSDGDLNLESNKDITVNSMGNIKVDALGTIELGDNPMKFPVNNIPNCFICGALHSTQTKVLV